MRCGGNQAGGVDRRRKSKAEPAAAVMKMNQISAMAQRGTPMRLGYLDFWNQSTMDRNEPWPEMAARQAINPVTRPSQAGWPKRLAIRRLQRNREDQTQRYMKQPKS